MSLLLDIFGFLSVLLRGATLTAYAVVVGGVVFVLGLARPLEARLNGAGPKILDRCRRLMTLGAAGLAVAVTANLAIQIAVLVGTFKTPPTLAIGADFVIAGVVLIVSALLVPPIGRSGWPVLLAVPAAAMAVAVAASSHAAARMDDRAPLILVTILHQTAAAAWIGGIPYFLGALAATGSNGTWIAVGRRFSGIAMVAVAVSAASGGLLMLAYVGSAEAFLGTTYGIMIVPKTVLFAGLLGLAAFNFRSVRGSRSPSPPDRLLRFAEVEIGVGITILFAAASLTSQPPAIDLTTDRVGMAEIVHRLTPTWPRLTSPDHDTLAIPRLMADEGPESRAYVPGSGRLLPNTAEDIAWSEYNHNWAGAAVLAIGLLAMAERTGRARWAGAWPLLFLPMAAFLMVRADPETWPMGRIGFLDSLRDPEVVQHRVLLALVVTFSLFEWGVRRGRIASPRAALVFPVAMAVGGALLLTHTHQLVNVRDVLLTEVSHIPLALLGIAAGWARWLELRLASSRGRAVAGWTWTACFVLVGVLLLTYRES